MAVQVKFDRTSFTKKQLDYAVENKSTSIGEVELVSGTFYVSKNGEDGIYLFGSYLQLMGETNTVTSVNDGYGDVKITAESLGITDVYQFKGSKQHYAELEAIDYSTVEIGDVYDVKDTGMNYACSEKTTKSVPVVTFKGLKQDGSTIVLHEGEFEPLPTAWGSSAGAGNYQNRNCYLRTDGAHLAFLYCFDEVTNNIYILASRSSTGSSYYYCYDCVKLDDYPNKYTESNPPMSDGQVVNLQLTDFTIGSESANTVVWDALGGSLDISGKQNKITANGILKGDGQGIISAATAGTDYVKKATAGNGLTYSEDGDVALTAASDTTDGTISSDAFIKTVGEINITASNTHIDTLQGWITIDNFPWKTTEIRTGARMTLKLGADMYPKDGKTYLLVYGEPSTMKEIYCAGANVGSKMKIGFYDLIYDGAEWQVLGGVLDDYALASTVEEDEEVTAKALNDLHTRTNTLETLVPTKQDQLNETQLAAVNSGMTTEKVKEYDTQVSNYTTVYEGAGISTDGTTIGIKETFDNLVSGLRILFKPNYDASGDVKLAVNGQAHPILYNGENVNNRMTKTAVYDMIFLVETTGSNWHIIGGMGSGIYWQNED